ncbi:MAG: hypothetical protein DMG79_05350 [Acidobacteria bacterium]|nr:MAG: hypothetical protein DMG79_05350 [Acidobacteriota bacterium]
MILVTQIHRASEQNALLFLCAIGFGAGVTLFFYGFRLLQRRRLIVDVPLSIGPRSQSLPVQSEAHHEIVMLSSEPAALKSSEMSQQQKIAAALFRAGIPSPATWATAGATSPGGTQVLTDADAPNDKADSAATHPEDFDPHPRVVLVKGASNKTLPVSCLTKQEVARSLDWKCFLIMWGGAILALSSVYFFIRIETLF